MCGICGLNDNDEPLVTAMTGQLTHRGPDQHGAYCCEHVSLGHRRLSIIDLSEHGRQPMANEDGSLRLVFNGEIYNFQELRADLEARGHTFSSRSDSESILHAYEEYGIEGALERLRGMFAFALWDARERCLVLARDRIGIKPLYYCWLNGRLVFASEIKAILQDPKVPRSVNTQAVFQYLGFEFVPAPSTMFDHIHKLPAGHFARLHDGEFHVERYWDLSFAPAADAPRTIEEAVERERAELDFAVKSHLVSDVPLGVFLSGGLDSSALVAMMRRHISGPLRTFTVGYSDKSFSELDYADIVARRFDTEHHVLMLDDLTESDVEKAAWHLDEPMTDLSAIPLYFACRKAREHITVCLSGEGGDESFAGYDRFKASRINRAYRWIPGLLRKHAIDPIVDRIPDQPRKKGLANMLKRFVEGARLPDEGSHLRWQYFLYPETARDLFLPGVLDRIDTNPFTPLRPYHARSDAADAVNREIYLDMRFMMTDSVLMKVDKMSMAHSLEIRVPLLDHGFVEYNARLPGAWKLKGFTTKHILRRSLEGILPDSIVYRGKQGYSLPVKNLLRGQLREYMTRLLHESMILRELTDPSTVDRLIREHLELKHNHNHVLWGLMNVAIWHNTFFP